MAKQYSSTSITVNNLFWETVVLVYGLREEVERAVGSIVRLVKFLTTAYSEIKFIGEKLAEERAKIVWISGKLKEVKVKDDIIVVNIVDEIPSVDIEAIAKGTSGCNVWGCMGTTSGAIVDTITLCKLAKLGYIEADKELMDVLVKTKLPVEDYILVRKTRISKDGEVEVNMDELKKKLVSSGVSVKAGITTNLIAQYSDVEYNLIRVDVIGRNIGVYAVPLRRKYYGMKIINIMSKWFINNIPEMAEHAVKQIVKLSEYFYL